ncbi:hypothetical protein TUM20983_37090 [Mycobacterium antarcticum]|uniref:V-type ATPase subunit n=1 Tax=Mycolicibacterium sp. TUM20983 TaxID=3023369 RepID=UPI00239D6B42|nr:V-type ATPase subunit [Mycolicibacterium sp. TUM20983]GLP76599.1 hypothetical protein TUM20983_37090 [Mycolicibacterium sp. TUM20983]
MTGRIRAVPSRDADLVAGNTRLRARLRELVSGEQAEALAGRPLPDLAETLRGVGVTAGPAAGRVGEPTEAWRAELLAAVDTRRNGLLRAAAAAYQGAARGLVEALFDTEDRADLVTLLRAAATATPAQAVLGAVHAVGRLDAAAMRDLVAGEPDAIVPRLLTARLPDPDTAAVLARAWERYTLHTDLAELEATVAVAHAEATRRRVAAMGVVGAPVAEHLARQRDAVNLVAAVRLRGANPPPSVFLPAGHVPLHHLRAVAAGRDVAAVTPARWRAAAAAAEPRGPEPLARVLDDLIDAEARHPSWRTEPLGARVPRAYVALVHHEARALRLLVVLAPDRPDRPQRRSA